MKWKTELEKNVDPDSATNSIPPQFQDEVFYSLHRFPAADLRMSSFRKRNVIISKRGEGPPSPSPPKQHDPSTRPSPVTGHATTSTGTASLDRLLGLGAGLALGSSLLIEEEGTTEFARSLLGAFAAEGVLQGHAVFVVGPEGGLSLPGVAEERGKGKSKGVGEEKMKIAWRYERLGGFGERERERGGFPSSVRCTLCLKSRNDIAISTLCLRLCRFTCPAASVE